MSNFKERAIRAIRGCQSEYSGAEWTLLEQVADMLDAIPDDEHSGEKTCGPNYEKECQLLREQLAEMGAEKDELENLRKEAYQEIHNLKSLVARLEGFRDGVILGINARNQIETAKELRNCCNRMEDSYE